MPDSSNTCRVPLIISLPQPASFGSGPFIANPCSEIDTVYAGDSEACWLPLWNVETMDQYRDRHRGDWPDLRVTHAEISQGSPVFQAGEARSDGTYVRTVRPLITVEDDLDLPYTLTFKDNAVSANQQWDPTIKVKPRSPAPPPAPPGQSSSTEQGTQLVVWLQFTVPAGGGTPQVVNPEAQIDPLAEQITSIRFVPLWLEDDLRRSVDETGAYPELSITDFKPLNPAHASLFGEQVLGGPCGDLLVVIRPDEMVPSALEMAYQLTYEGGPSGQTAAARREDWAGRLDVQPRSASEPAACVGA